MFTDEIAPYMPQLIAAWSIHWVGVLSPGPGVALILSVASARGRTASLATAFGIAMASTCFAIVTVLGLSAVLSQLHWLMTVVRYIGAAYLLFLAFKAFRTAATNPPFEIKPVRIRSHGTSALTGFALQITNPKAIFFWLAIAAVAGMATAPLSVVILFVIVAFFNSLIAHSAWAVLLSSVPFRAAYAGARRWVEGALGVFFAAFAFKLATDRG